MPEPQSTHLPYFTAIKLASDGRQVYLCSTSYAMITLLYRKPGLSDSDASQLPISSARGITP